MKLRIALLVGFLCLVPATSSNAFTFDCFNSFFGYSQPPRREVQKPKQEPKPVPQSHWKEFKQKAKPVQKKSNWSFWGTQSRGVENGEYKNVTDERTTTETFGSRGIDSTSEIGS